MDFETFTTYLNIFEGLAITFSIVIASYSHYSYVKNQNKFIGKVDNFIKEIQNLQQNSNIQESSPLEKSNISKNLSDPESESDEFSDKKQLSTAQEPHIFIPKNLSSPIFEMDEPLTEDSLAEDSTDEEIENMQFNKTCDLTASEELYSNYKYTKDELRSKSDNEIDYFN